MSEEEASKLGIEEYGGGSWGIQNNRRRVAHINLEDIRRAVYLNTPTEIALTGMDYLDPNAKGSQLWDALSFEAKEFVRRIEEISEVPVSMISTGQETDSMITR